jgi:4-phytase / acid phosphatase
MTVRDAMTKRNALAIVCFVFALTGAVPPVAAQTDAPADESSLQLVIVLSRHGVRSPTHPQALDAYSNQKWAAWNVPPGYLTPHGRKLMQSYGAAYRRWYGSALGWTPGACPSGPSVFVWADVDERTRATGRAVADGFAPNCNLNVGTAQTAEDPLFDPPGEDSERDPARADAAVLGAIGASPESIPTAFGADFVALQRVMGRPLPATTFEGATKTKGAGLAGGLDLAADAAENLLLEYTDGKPVVGWGRVDRAALLQVLQLHVLAKRIEHNRYSSQLQAAPIARQILMAMQQASTDIPAPGVMVPASARFVFFSGHDTQLEEMSAMFGLSWLVTDDQMNDTPPGSALVFELRKSHQGAWFVRTSFSAQTLDDMRAGRGDRPVRVPVYVPGCPAIDCPLPSFVKALNAAIIT